ncbi:signal peptidase [Gloeophyllum trabeum ATCC 11539]|uniref:Signal peptidase subunit 3 n=1 Tax=Gloeophyllum trabeum (strain ATCC 11539 / FP-39264 / Madison 617) TaxID=670483 RepID=S7RR89_GLOTA|nr:signal peptidase [Gloeophyllum trabeum ATCC 11539]EPQ57140.1 signal peptidase [Gloeophyllum trabeum ATCC 11539]
MHSLYARLNNFSAFLSSCLMGLLAAIALSSFLFTAEPKGELTLASVKVFPGSSRRMPTVKQEFTFVNFNISADLTPLFHWNTKQLFVYLQAEYVDSKGVQNDVVLWDSIIRRKQDAVLNIAGRNKYVFRDLSRSFRNAQAANYTLRYNLMPYVGVLTYGEAGRTSEPVPFPEPETVS